MSDQIARDLVHTLCTTTGLNDFFENALPRIAELFGSRRAMLVDYHENTNHFDLLHFVGYPKQARFDLQRGLLSMDLQKALSEKGPRETGMRSARSLIGLRIIRSLSTTVRIEWRYLRPA